MKLVELKGTDLKVSPICLGTWQFNAGEGSENSLSTWKPQSIETSKSIFNKAIEVGINFFDTAEAYKNSEFVLGQCLAGGCKRQDVVVASKFGYCKPQDQELGYTAIDIDQHLTDTLRNLQTPYLDIYQVHWPVVVNDVSETVTELKRQQGLGRIRYYGLCNAGEHTLQQFADAGGTTITNQLPYNLLWRGIEYEIMGACMSRGVSILPYSALQQGLLTGKFNKASDVPEGRRRTRHFSKNSTTLSRHGEEGAEEETFQAISQIRDVCARQGMVMSKACLSWLLGRPQVCSVIVGASSVEQVVENSEVVELDERVMCELAACTDGLKSKLGPVVDMWASVPRVM